MFTHLDYLSENVDLETVAIDGTRFYITPSGKKYPSITSVTSFYNRDIFIRWRKKVGEEKANKITRESTFRGTKYHDLVEHYMKNEDINDLNVLPSTKFLFLQSKEHLDRINNIHALEKSMYSDYLGLAGRVDCIAEFDGELAVIDFKKIILSMDKDFESIEFDIDDIVRSGLVRNYLLTKIALGM